MSLSKHADLFHFLSAFEKDAVFDYQLTKMAANSADIINTGNEYQAKITDPELATQFASFLDAYKEFVSSIPMNKENLTEEALEKGGAAYHVFQKAYSTITKNKSPYMELNDDFNTGLFAEFLNAALGDVNEKVMLLSEQDEISDMKAQEVAEIFNEEEKQESREGDARIDYTAKKIQNAKKSQKDYYAKIQWEKKFNPEGEIAQRAFQSAVNARIRANEKEQELKKTNPAEYERRREARRLKGQQNSKAYYDKIRAGYVISRKDMRTLLGILKAKKEGEKTKEDFEMIERLTNILGLIDHSHYRKNVEQGEKINTTKNSGSLKGLIIKLQQSLASQKTVLKDILAGGKTFDEIKKRISSERNGIFRPYLEAIEKAKIEGDLAEETATTKALQNALNQFASQQPEVSAFDFMTTSFYEFRDLANKLDEQISWLTEKGSEVDPEILEGIKVKIKNEIVGLKEKANEVATNFNPDDLLKQLNMSPGDADFRTNERAVKLFKTPISKMNDIVRHLDQLKETF